MAGPEHRDYHHPYQPYSVQTQFMDAVYNCLEYGQVGIFESPTGTGKSLSLICASLAWLRDHKRKCVDAETAVDATDASEPDWVVEHERKEKLLAVLQRSEKLRARLATVRENEEEARRRYANGEPLRKRPRVDEPGGRAPVDETAFLLDDYDSDKEQKATTSSKNGLSAEIVALLSRLDEPNSSIQNEEEAELDDAIKIFFCSRTHSQLSQFASELRRTTYATSSANPADSTPEQDLEQVLNEAVKYLSLGSRKTLCINPKVSKLGNASSINERCMELQQSSIAADQRCSFLPTAEKEALVNDFRDHALAVVRDIEDLGALGKRIGICPYYASRAAIRPSEVVSLPYPLLLQRSAREALNISLKGHIVIFDEAHNLLDAISSIHSVSVSLRQVQQARSQLLVYLQKFRNRLRGKNRVYVAQVVRVLDSIVSGISRYAERPSGSGGRIVAADVMAGKGVDQINLYRLLAYLRESKLARKVDGYNDFVQDPSGPEGRTTLKPKKTMLPVLNQVQEFVTVLTYPDPEGCFFWSTSRLANDSSSDVLLRYLLLDPTQHFKEIVEDARAIVLAGGTMSPMGDYTDHLFSYLPPSRLQTLSCDHVIPSSNLLVLPLPSGSQGQPLEFTFEKRGSTLLMEDLGATIVHIANNVPDGLVVFFPSYAYLDSVVKFWRSKSSGGRREVIWDQLQATKRIFMESSSRMGSNDANEATGEFSKAEEVLAAYSSHIQDPSKHNGALMLAVVGGSLSEGINFSDRLGRGIVVVGLPFPNAQSPEWKAKVEFAQKDASLSREGGAFAAKELATNTCMRAVNQSIGRAIRHKDDYAVIVLLDRRYGREDIRKKLPRWVLKSFTASRSQFPDNMAMLRDFFQAKK